MLVVLLVFQNYPFFYLYYDTNQFITWLEHDLKLAAGYWTRNAVNFALGKQMTARHHHYLSQCYLKGFTKGGSKKSKLKVFDLRNKKIFETIPRNVGGIRSIVRVALHMRVNCQWRVSPIYLFSTTKTKRAKPNTTKFRSFGVFKCTSSLSDLRLRWTSLAYPRFPLRNMGDCAIRQAQPALFCPYRAAPWAFRPSFARYGRTCAINRFRDR